MNLPDKIAFIDEYGTDSFKFDRPHVSTHFIITCIIVNTNELDIIKSELEVIRKQYFQTGEIKSKNIGSNDKNRLKILSDIAKVNFNILSLVVDKRKLTGEGFQYKSSFYKFLQNIILKELHSVFSSYSIVIDNHGTDAFMTSFINYIRSNYPSDLFSSSKEIEYQDSKDNILIQLADFISGTFARVFDETKKSEYANNFLKILNHKLPVFQFFPRDRTKLEYIPKPNENNIDDSIMQLALKLSDEFITKYENSVDFDKRIQVRTLDILQLNIRTINYRKYISTKEILSKLNFDSQSPIKEYYFRTNIIAKLRDDGQLISSSKLGYKLPTSKSDLYDFINHGNLVIIPMLKRLIKFVDKIKISNSIDILEKPEYEILNKIYKCRIFPES